MGKTTSQLFLSFLAIFIGGNGHPVSWPKGAGTAEHVLIIGCDGFGGMYLENATSFLPNIKMFYDNGAVTTRARAQMPSVSAPNWATIITGMGPVESGVYSNDWVPCNDNPPDSVVLEMPPISGAGKNLTWSSVVNIRNLLTTRKHVDSGVYSNDWVPSDDYPPDSIVPISGAGKIPETLWQVAKTQKPTLKTASVESWDWIHYLVEPGIVDYEYRGKENDSACASALKEIIIDHQPNLMFIHFDTIDNAGHAHGWGSPDYYTATKNVDGYIGEIFQALNASGILDKTLVMLTADHGGYRFEHGFFDEPNIYIPALFMGPGVKKGYKITSYVTNKDFSATGINALGLKLGQYMTGRVVEDIYN